MCATNSKDTHPLTVRWPRNPEQTAEAFLLLSGISTLTFLGGVLFRLPLVLKAYSRLWDKNTRDRYLTSHQDDPSELTHTENKIFSNVCFGKVCPRMSIQRPEEDVGGLLYHCQPCSLDTGSLMEPRARLAVSKSSNPSVPPLPTLTRNLAYVGVL